MSYSNIDPYATSGARELLKYLQSQFGWGAFYGLSGGRRILALALAEVGVIPDPEL
jgi:hypothetical protein